jgi:hypothetical protein
MTIQHNNDATSVTLHQHKPQNKKKKNRQIYLMQKDLSPAWAAITTEKLNDTVHQALPQRTGSKRRHIDKMQRIKYTSTAIRQQ